ncbi:unnamed protein product [Cyclocybe aegerita]|uniref:Uncharacterized protein n=1 Tax=Cyclocybe aegerita TaxID=1973307 RepID=A0A8S0W0G7_CYCAE|nr:unnamed protein product [Cyclocybe aegerita]
MSIKTLPPELLYDIVADVVAGYVDWAVTCPPRGGWETMRSGSEHDFGSDDEEDDLDEDDDASYEEDDGAYEQESEDASPPLPPQDDFCSTPTGLDSLHVDTSQEDPDDDDYLGFDVSEDGDAIDPEDAFQIWCLIESKERLPENHILSLLGVDHSIRETTIKILEDAISIERGPNGSLHPNPWPTLRLLRKRYRIGHTQPFTLSHFPKYHGPMTPFIEGYLSLAGMAYFLRNMYRLVSFDNERRRDAVTSMLSMAGTPSEILQPVLRTRIARRAYISMVHMRRYISVSIHCSTITDTYKEIFSLRGTRRNPGFIVHEDKVPIFKQAVHDFAIFDFKHMERKPYPELPGILVDLSGVIHLLSSIKKLKYVSEFRGVDEVMEVVAEATALLERWKVRLEISSYIVLEDWPDMDVSVSDLVERPLSPLLSD